jgi:hypothetical protein
MTKIKNIACAICALCGLFSCSDWDDHYEGTDVAGSNQTLWQQMKANPQLSDFCQVLEQTKVFRMHKKTPVSYSQLLDGGQSFTVVAPVNGTFNRDSLLQLVNTNQGDSVVERFFVFNHLSRSVNSVSPETRRMLLLNSKHAEIGPDGIEGVRVTIPNAHAKNGVMHVTERPLPYRYSLYESLTNIPQINQIGNVLRSYEEDFFDADNSVSSGIVEGVPVYVDSVVIERNKMLQRIGYLNAEDSTYMMVVPTNEGWNKAWNEATKHFVYDEKMQKRDSIQLYWTVRALLDDAIFNVTDQKSINDSLMSVQYNRSKPEYHVFYKPFDVGGILHGAQKMECSNGELYLLPEWPFTPESTYFKEIWSEGEYTHMITAEKDCFYNVRRLATDSISEGGYLHIVPRTATANWELTYRVNNTLSGDYDICAIILPKSVDNAVNPNLKPCKFKATINYVDTLGNAQSFNCNNVQFKTDPEKVDTVVIAEGFHFPVCNYDQSDIKVSVKIQCSILARETSTYNREMYLDCIYLRPRTSKSEE